MGVGMAIGMGLGSGQDGSPPVLHVRVYLARVGWIAQVG